MSGYSHEFGSQYPSSIMTLGTHKDIDDTVVSLINQFNALMESGNRSGAAALYDSNKTLMKPYMIDIGYINYLEEEIYNVGIKAISQFNTLQSVTEPDIEQDEGSYWVQEYE